MSEKAEVKPDALPDLDDLLQCPVCYEIPSGQIFQCNEGHHVCGRCKIRLDVCPVCRALFFGTRNYAMEELIANVRKLRAFKLGGKVTTGSPTLESASPAKETTSEEVSDETTETDDNELQISNRSTIRPPQACKGLFRCLCCKNGNAERLPAARLLNHLRYFHSPELIESQSDNGEYVQAWQFSTVPGRIVTAVRVTDMGIFFLIIEISNDNVCAWLSMASSPWVAHEFCYTVTISGNDREAIFSDCVWSVRSCEGSLKKRGHCLTVTGGDARALVAPVSISGKLSVRRAPADALAAQTQPRAVLRVANRGTNNLAPAPASASAAAHDLEPFLQDLQNDVARLSRAFATLGREANALARSEAEMRARIEDRETHNRPSTDATEHPTLTPAVTSPTESNQPDNVEIPPMSRNARRRMRQRMRAAFNISPERPPAVAVTGSRRQNAGAAEHHVVALGPLVVQLPVTPPSAPMPSVPQRPVPPPPVPPPSVPQRPVPPPPVPPQPSGGPSNGLPQNGNATRANKKKRRQRR